MALARMDKLVKKLMLNPAYKENLHKKIMNCDVAVIIGYAR
jgi:hypothetical protein